MLRDAFELLRPNSAARAAAPSRAAATNSSAETGPVEDDAATATAASARQDRTEIFPAFRGWTARYLAETDGAARRTMEAEGVALAAARRAALRETIARDPRAALRAAVPWSVRRSLPPAIAAQLEERVDGVGDLDVIAARPADDAAAADAEFRPVRRVAWLEGRPYDAYVFGRREQLRSRRSVALHGVAVDGALALSDSPVRFLEPGEPIPAGRTVEEMCPISQQPTGPGSSAVASDVPAADTGDRIIYVCSAGHIAALAERLSAQEISTPPIAAASAGESSFTTGAKRLLFIRVRFADQAASFAPQTETAAATTCSEAAQFLNENSFGALTLQATITPVYVLPQTAAWYRDNDASTYGLNVLQAARAIAANPASVASNSGLAAFNYLDFDFEAVRYSGGPGSFSGQGYVGVRGCWMKTDSSGVLAHELGHNLGLWHANAWNPADPDALAGSGSNLEYGDGFDTMGQSSGGGWHFNTYEKTQLGWLPAAGVRDAEASGTLRIFAHDAGASADASHPMAIRVRRDADRDVWIEFRQHPIWATNPWLAHGVSVRWDPWESSNGGTQLLDATPASPDLRADSALTLGRTMSDPVAGVHITPLRQPAEAPGAIDVDVHLGAFPGNRAPLVTLQSAATHLAVNETIALTANASDPDGDELAYAWDFGDRSVGANRSGATKAWSSPGVYRARVTVSDLRGGTASASVLVRVGSSAAHCVFGTVTDFAGNPVADVRVSNGLALTSSDRRDALTDSDGSFALCGLPAGNASFAATRPGWVFVRHGFGATVPVSGDVSEIRFVGYPVGFRIAGAVRHADGTPARGALVSAGTRTEPTDANGAFAIAGVPAGTYTLTTTSADSVFEAPTVVVPFADVGGIVIDEPTFTIAGEITGVAAGAVLTVTDGWRATTTYTDGSGPTARVRFALPGVPAGNWHLRVLAADGSFSAANFSNPLEVTGPRGGLVLAKDLFASSALSGRVLARGRGVAGASVIAGATATTTDSWGAYFLSGFGPGARNVSATAPGMEFVPASRTVTFGAASISGIDFVATETNAAPVFVENAAAQSALDRPYLALAARAGDDRGGGQLRYTWSVAGAAPGAVVFTENGTNNARETHAIFTTAGAYGLRVTATDAEGAAATSDVSVVLPSLPARLWITPETSSANVGDTIVFTAHCLDQFGAPVAGDVAVHWSASGGGAMAADGKFTATTPGEDFVIEAGVGGLFAEARVSITARDGPPTIVAAASANPAVVGAALTTNLAVTATSRAGESTLTYTWEAIGANPGGVAFLPNGTNGAKRSTARFVRAGDYSLRVIVRDSAGQQAESRVSVRVQQTFASWRNAFFDASELDTPALEASRWGGNADPDGDGVPNLLEYAFALDPLVAGIDGLPSSSFVHVAGEDFLAVTFHRNPGAADLVFTPQASSDLEHWESGLVPVGDAAANPVTYRDPTPVSAHEKRFVRVQVTAP